MESKPAQTPPYQHEVDKILEVYQEYSEDEVCPAFRDFIKEYGIVLFQEKRPDLLSKLRNKFEPKEVLSRILISALTPIPDYDNQERINRMEQILLFSKQHPSLLENIDLLNEVPLLYEGFEKIIQYKDKLIENNTYRISLEDSPEKIRQEIARNKKLFQKILNNFNNANPDHNNRSIEISRPNGMVSVHIMINGSNFYTNNKAIYIEISPSKSERDWEGLYFSPYRLVLDESGIIEQYGYGNPDMDNIKRFLYRGYSLVSADNFPEYPIWPIDELVFLQRLAGINGSELMREYQGENDALTKLFEADLHFEDFVYAKMG